MTTQNNLERIWASTGSAIDPNATNYAAGWVAEIPTFQEFNYVLKNLCTNQLALAEAGCYTWQVDIAYAKGSKVLESGKVYTCLTANTGQLVTNTNYWTLGAYFGSMSLSNNAYGVMVEDVNTRTDSQWEGSDITLRNSNAVLQLSPSSGAYDHWLLHNVQGELGVTNTESNPYPDGRLIDYNQTNTHRLYHEGHRPTQTEVSGTIPENPADGSLYARQNSSWVPVTSTKIQSTPPSPLLGSGQGWYNLEDGQLYLDIDDGSSSQWVPANAPIIPSNVWTQQSLNITETDGIGSVQIMKNISGASIPTNAVVAGSALGRIFYTSAGTLSGTLSPAGSWRNLYHTQMPVNYYCHFVRVA